MQQIINFILRNKTTLLFLFYLFIALALTLQNHAFHRSKAFNSANRLSGSIYNTNRDIRSYFLLEEENRQLLEENKRLRWLLVNQRMTDTLGVDSTLARYTVATARVIKNSYANPDNYVTLDKGASDGLEQDMGVITPEGILGIVEHTTANFASVQSILNTRSTINAKIKDSNHFGSLTWDTRDFNTVQLEDIPRMVNLHIGDTIVTGAMSSIFPENIPIGTIKKFDLNQSQSFYSIDVELFTDMTNLGYVYVIRNLEGEEIDELEEITSNEQ